MSEFQAEFDLAKAELDNAVRLLDSKYGVWVDSRDKFGAAPTNSNYFTYAGMSVSLAEAYDLWRVAQGKYEAAEMDLHQEDVRLEVERGIDPAVSLSVPDHYRALYDAAQQAVREYLDDDLTTDSMSALGDLCGIGPNS